MTRYVIPEAESLNLLGEKAKDAKEGKEKFPRPVTHIKSRVTFTIMTDDVEFPIQNVPMELVSHLTYVDAHASLLPSFGLSMPIISSLSLSLRIVQGRTFLPIVNNDFLQTRRHDLIKIMPWHDKVNVTLRYSPISLGKLRLLLHVETTMQTLKNLGFSDKDVDEVKGIFADTNVYILGATFFIAAVHVRRSIDGDENIYKIQV